MPFDGWSAAIKAGNVWCLPDGWDYCEDCSSDYEIGRDCNCSKMCSDCNGEGDTEDEHCNACEGTGVRPCR